eukprot:TRINITY_DN24025_c0_g1_i1.p3 TRINITY_DN24025_c0_g1~~TRINITY_DN24025_c0_g1_i1.p3  ORF type:complete len:100 (-),score=7.85 TRINITY_DN24025_c0_g1_i1:246-545(-)
MRQLIIKNQIKIYPISQTVARNYSTVISVYMYALSNMLLIFSWEKPFSRPKNVVLQLIIFKKIEQWPDFGCEGIKVQRAHQPTSQCYHYQLFQQRSHNK